MHLVERLRAAGCVFAEQEAALLTAEASDADDLKRRVTARVAGAPLELVLGWAAFAGLRVPVEPGVFVPRRRTELLVDAALGLLRPADADGEVLVDLGCGTGAIAAAVAVRHPDVEVWAVDIDPAAVACARRTLAAYLAPHTLETRVVEGDLYDALPDRLRGRVALVAANAPYVPTSDIALMPREARDHEHRVALDGGADGLAVQRRAADGAGRWLRPGGHLLVETSARQAAATSAVLRDAGLRTHVVRDDDPDGPGGCVVVGRLS